MLNLQLRGKLILFFLLIGLIPLIIVGFLSYNNAQDEIEEQVYAALNMYAGLADMELEDYFAEREGDIQTFATTSDIYQSMNLARDLDWEIENEQWQDQLRELDPFVSNYADIYGYGLAFLTDPDGNVLYSTNNDIEPGTDLSGRDYIQGAMEEELTWSELFYSDVINANALVISVPVRSEGQSGEFIGTANLMMDQNRIDHIIHDGLEELGDSADAYLINEDGLLLTNTLIGEYADGAALNRTIDTRAVELLSGPIRRNELEFAAAEEYPEYRGVPVLGQTEVSMLGDTPVGLVVEVDQDEVFAGIQGLRNIVIFIVILAALAIIIVAYFIAKSISKPVASATNFAKKVASGNLRKTVEKEYLNRNDEIGGLLKGLQEMKENMGQVLRNVQESSMSVSSASEQISSGNEDLSQRTQEQASSLEEFSASVEEMTSSMESSTANANEAKTISNNTKESVMEGEEVVDDLGESMTKITESSKEISEIIDQVNDIAFQTNLLALNAAVEAARAGEAGQGFAVVASEVRNLAGRSAEAAKDIENLISDSIEKIENGNKLMNETEEVLKEIIENTEKTTDVVGEIAASLQEQTTAADEINNSIEELNQVTQENASLVEEIASSSENMNGEAEELSELVNHFKLSERKKDLINNINNNQKGQNIQSSGVNNKTGSQNSKIDDDSGTDFDEDEFEKF